MVRPTRDLRRFTAKRVFTDREDAQSHFLQALAQPQSSDEYRILSWYGVGGQGKSALLRELERKCRFRSEAAINLPSHRRIGWALIDLNDAKLRRIDGALLSIRLQLARRAGVQFPAFDTAFARYVSLRNPGVDLRQRHPELFVNDNELLGDLLNLGGDGIKLAEGIGVPGVGLLYKYGTRLRGRLKTWWDARGKQVLADLDELSAEQILLNLPIYLGSDFSEALEEESPPRLVILVDTHEALWRESGIKGSSLALRGDEWLRLLVQESCGALIAICGRDKLRWKEIDPEWGEIIDEQPLEGLRDSDAELFLTRVPIENPEIRSRIIAGAQGLPFYLDLQVGHYEGLCRRSQTPVASQFGGTHPEILSCFLDHLGDEDERILRLASYSRALNSELLEELASEFLGGAAVVDWPRFNRWSFVTATEHGATSMHALMREDLQKRERTERPGIFRAVHQWLFEHYSDLASATSPRSVTAATEAAFRAAYRHLSAIKPYISGLWLLENWQPLHEAMRWSTLTEVFEDAAILFERELGVTHPVTIETRRNLACVYREARRFDLAEPLLEELLDREATLGVERRFSRATTLHELGRTCTDMGSFAAAERHFLQSLRLSRSLAGSNVEVFTLHELGTVYRLTGRFELAERQFLNVLRIEKYTLGEEDPVYGTALVELGRVYFEQGQLVKAKERFERALEIYRGDLGSDHHYCWRATHWLALAEAGLGNREAARTLLRDALEGWADQLEPDHMWLAEARAALLDLG